MYNNEKKIIEYLDGVMLQEDREAFEKELSSDKVLRDLFSSIQSRFEKLKTPVKGDPAPDYFSNIIPEFRAKLANEKGIKSIVKNVLASVYDFMLSLRGAGAVSLISVLLIWALFFRNGSDSLIIENTRDLELALGTETDAGIESIQDEYLIQGVYEDLLSGLGIEQKDVDDIFIPEDYIAYNIKDLSEEELDTVIKEMER